jgi:drug/metabolite transporter (DMT)-like permease
MGTVFYGLTAAACYGAGDFSGGVASKRNNVYGVVVMSQLVGLVLLLATAILTGETLPGFESMLWAALAGIFGGTGLIALYAGLAQGRMGVTAPVAAVVTTIVPVIIGIRAEGLPGTGQLVGFGLAFVAVWLVSRTEDGHSIKLSDLKLPVFAGLGFGLFMVFIDQAGEEAVFWPTTAVRVASISLIFIATRFMQSGQVSISKHFPIVVLAGVFDSAGNVFLVLAMQAGRLDIAAVVSSLYPAGTVLLAWLLLKEHICKQQWLGLLAALIAILLITG